jgi:ABC-type bacteriocin/lantibiotic exporter with double-glycine peptidase domain
LIADALHRLCAGRTVITISHTVGLLEGCDVVFRLDGGQISSESLPA